MGPTVCDEEGPTPIEKRSNVDITACSARGRVEESGIGEGDEEEGKERISEWEREERWNERCGGKGSRIGAKGRSRRAGRRSMARERQAGGKPIRELGGERARARTARLSGAWGSLRG